HTPATYHLLSARRLKLMPPHAILINTARGEIIDESALATLLAEGGIAGAGLDVFEFEPRINPKLLKLPNAVLLPHLGSATLEGRIDMGEKVIINIRTWMDGHKPPDRVIPAKPGSKRLTAGQYPRRSAADSRRDRRPRTVGFPPRHRPADTNGPRDR